MDPSAAPNTSLWQWATTSWQTHSMVRSALLIQYFQRLSLYGSGLPASYDVPWVANGWLRNWGSEGDKGCEQQEGERELRRVGSRLLHTQVRAHAPTAQGRVTEGESKSEGRMKERCNIRKGRGNEERNHMMCIDLDYLVWLWGVCMICTPWNAPLPALHSLSQPSRRFLQTQNVSHTLFLWELYFLSLGLRHFIHILLFLFWLIDWLIIGS